MRAKNYIMQDGQLYRRIKKELRFIPAEKERIMIMEGIHDEIGNWNFATTKKIVSGRFWWAKIRPGTAQFERSCNPCQKANTTEQSTTFGKIPVSGFFHSWTIYFAGPSKETEAENKYL